MVTVLGGFHVERGNTEVPPPGSSFICASTDQRIHIQRLSMEHGLVTSCYTIFVPLSPLSGHTLTFYGLIGYTLTFLGIIYVTVLHQNYPWILEAQYWYCYVVKSSHPNMLGGVLPHSPLRCLHFLLFWVKKHSHGSEVYVSSHMWPFFFWPLSLWG